MIPKIIHYCWFGGRPKPTNVLKYMSTWSKHLPDYEIREWNESNFDINYNKFTEEAYAAKKYAFVSDVVRLHALANYGGIYLDTDIEVVKSFDDLLDKDYFIGYEHFGGIGTGVIGASVGTGFIQGFLESYDNRFFVNPNGTFNETPNTSLLMEYIKENGLHLEIHDIDYFCAKNYQTGEIEQTVRTYCIHHYSASWKPWYAKLEMKVCNMLGLKYRDYLFRHLSR